MPTPDLPTDLYVTLQQASATTGGWYGYARSGASPSEEAWRATYPYWTRDPYPHLPADEHWRATTWYATWKDPALHPSPEIALAAILALVRQDYRPVVAPSPFLEPEPV